MRPLAGFVCVLALGTLTVLGCSEDGGMGGAAGSGASAGTAGNGGFGGLGGGGGSDLCEAIDCDDGNPCTEDACDPADGSCSHAPAADGTECAFGADPGQCDSGECVSLCRDVDCNDENQCTEDVCDRATGECVNTRRPDGARCDLGELPGVCESGVCVDAQLCREVDCGDDNDCTDDVCDPTDGSCSNPNKVDGATCDLDGLPGVCEAGVCVSVNQPPIAKLTAYPLTGEVPRTVDFDASGSTDPDGDSLHYSWKVLADGDSVVTTTPQWSHLFDQAGDYDVLLTVFDTDGASDTALAVVSLAPPALTNSDFEEASGGLPLGWSSGEWRPYTDFAWEPNTGRGGSSAVRITTDSATPNDAWWYQPVQLTPNTLYNLSGWVKGENIAGGATGANVSVLDTWTHSDSSGSTGTFDWKQVWVTFQTDALGQVSIAPRLGFWGSVVSGTAWYDDLNLTADDFAPPLSSKHLWFDLERTDLAMASSEALDRWLQHLDGSYEGYTDLVGDVPYGGELQRVLSVRQYPGGWAVAGNPILWMQEYIGTAISRVHSDDDWSFGILHEISHSFDLDDRWVFQAEFSANLKLYYVVTTLNGRVRFAGTLYEGIALRDPYEQIHQEAVATQSYNWNAMTFRFILLAEQLGWDTYQRTYRAFLARDPANLPITPSDKLEAFLDELSAQAGTDVEMLIPAVELSWMRANI